MRILITGGLGYVGSNLVQKLLDLNFKVRVLDLKLYGDLLFDNDKNLELFIGDIRDQSIVNKSLENVDVVIHLLPFQMIQVSTLILNWVDQLT